MRLDRQASNLQVASAGVLVQFIAMLIGSGASVFVSVGAYMLFTTSYEVPGPLFPAPSAEIWWVLQMKSENGRVPQ